ncbi:ENTH domain-containing protein C794.11c-like [Herrania umbratica]|uniref:ENTH domain-containing protein C794.11c-like n=1 Tax=Herrania umbratica TaxID=108875 RepID=A0A6J1BA06_9ROSI|nr:ENTH domain-containing protein C794.11c-like [Herrania umbratica]
MGSLVFHEFKRQASFFLKEKIKTARLALTNVTPVELLTEEATDGNMPSPDACSMGAISRAAFEVDDYWRIVDILHKRLSKFDAKNWRASYNALVLLEHLLTHGPLRVAEEFQNHRDSIKEMGNFQYVDEKGFNWGLSVRKLSEKILMQLENELFLKEERARARKLTMGIKGFGSFSHLSSSKDQRFNSFSNHGGSSSQEDCFLEFKENLSFKEGAGLTEQDYNQNMLAPEKLEIDGDGFDRERQHPFCEDEQETAESLLSSTM